MSLFDAIPFLDDPMFIFFVISCGFFLRVGFVLADQFMKSVHLLWRRWQNDR